MTKTAWRQRYIRWQGFQESSDYAQIADEAGRPLIHERNGAVRPEQSFAQSVAAEEAIPGRERGENVELLRAERRRNFEAFDELRNMINEARRKSVCNPRVYDVPIENVFFCKMLCVFCGSVSVQYSAHARS